jgi:uncharacterized membrane protein YfcA
MPLNPIWLVAPVSVLAGAVAAVSGFGIGSLLTPVFMLAMPPQHAVAMVAIPHAVATLTRWFRLRGDLHGPTFKQFGIASAIGGLAGALAQTRMSGGVLTAVLALLLMLAGSSELTRRRVPLPETRFWRLFGGVLSGLFGGLVGHQGGIRTAALLGFGLTPRQIVATATTSALLVDLARVPIYLRTSGPVIAAGFPLWGTAAVGAVLGTFVGLPLLRSIPPPLYRRLVGLLLLLLGLSLLSGTLL